MKKIKFWLTIIMVVLTLTFFLAEFEYVDPIPYNEILFWLTLVVWSTLNLFSTRNKE